MGIEVSTKQEKMMTITADGINYVVPEGLAKSIQKVISEANIDRAECEEMRAVKEAEYTAIIDGAMAHMINMLEGETTGEANLLAKRLADSNFYDACLNRVSRGYDWEGFVRSKGWDKYSRDRKIRDNRTVEPL